jgi:hypothetical protein
MAKTKTRVLTDHEEIRRWAEERGAQPARVKGTGGDGDVGMIRLDFPGYTGEESLEPISWDEWFRKFDESNLALLVQDETARGERSNFNKLIGRETAQARAAGVRRASRRRLRTGAAAPGSRAGAAARTASRGGAKKTATRKSTSRKATRSTPTRGAAASSRTNARGSTRTKRTQSARGRGGSRRRAA